MIEAGTYPNLSSNDYHNDTNSISRSAIMDFKSCPKKYYANYVSEEKREKEVTQAMIFGSAFHTHILEPHLFDDEYIVKLEPVLLKEVGRENYDAYKQHVELCKNTHKKCITLQQYQQILDMEAAIKANSTANSLIFGGTNEMSFFWKDKASNLMIKSRPDIVRENVYIDLKTMADASAHVYQREMVNRGYHIQAAMVKDGAEVLTDMKINQAINICVEKTWPHAIGIYIIDETAIEAGQQEYKALLVAIKHARTYNEYTDYAVQIIGMPRWAVSSW